MLINQPPPELFAERPVRSDFASQGLSYRARRRITVLVVSLLLVGGLYQLFTRFHSRTSGEIPTIHAEGTYKQRPDHPGGLEIPNQNVEVYKSLDGSLTTNETTEKLLPPAETPEPSALLAPPKTTIGAEASAIRPNPQAEYLTSNISPKEDSSLVKPTPIENSAVSVAPRALAPAPSDQGKALPRGASALAPKKEVVSVAPQIPIADNRAAPARDLAKVAVTAPMSIVPAARASLDTTPDTDVLQKIPSIQKAPSPTAVNSPDAMPSTEDPIGQVLENQSIETKVGPVIQLTSVPDHAAAEQAMKKLQTKYMSILGPIHLRLVKADLGSRGIYYRIQSEALTSQEASRVCHELKKINAGCLLVR